MRIQLTLLNKQATTIPINYQYYLSSFVYNLMPISGSKYSRFFGVNKKSCDPELCDFRMFSFSWLRRVAETRFKTEADKMWISEGPLVWMLSSPSEHFLKILLQRLCASNCIKIENSKFYISKMRILDEPCFSVGAASFTCLSPIVLIDKEDEQTEKNPLFIKPSDNDRFSSMMQKNLIRKYEMLYHKKPEDIRFNMRFSESYLEHAKRRGVKYITVKDELLLGAYCPFTVSGSTELIKLGYQSGFGCKNSWGFGLVEKSYDYLSPIYSTAPTANHTRTHEPPAGRFV